MVTGSDEGPYDVYSSTEERESLSRAEAVHGVDAEIGAARVALIRLLSSGIADEKPELLLRAVESIVRAMRVKHQIGGGSAESLLDAADRILSELGYGGDE